MSDRVRRSMLYTPANDLEMMESGINSTADAIIFDLEDTVPRKELDGARANVEAICETVHPKIELCVRINSVETDEWIPDVLAVATVVDTIVVPKVEAIESLVTLVTVVDRVTDKSPEIIATLETPTGVFNAESIAERAVNCDNVTALSLGLEDYIRELGTTVLPTAVRDFVSVTVVSAAAIGGLEPLYTVTSEYENIGGLRDTAEWACDLGFRGMKAIHPNQLSVINEVFTPTDEEFEKAKAFVTAFDQSDKDSLTVDGTFLDTAVVEQYRDLLARHRAASRAEKLD